MRNWQPRQFRIRFAGNTQSTFLPDTCICFISAAIVSAVSIYFYEEHLVFGLHFHTFLFIAILIFTWLGFIPVVLVLISCTDYLVFLAGFLCLFYVQSAINRLWRSLSMMVLYGLAIVYTALVLVIITFLLF